MAIALVLSGGTGTRVGGDVPKQYIQSDGRMLITYCLDMFISHPDVSDIFIVADEKWHDMIFHELRRLQIDTSKIAGFSKPGATRQLSILSGLRDIAQYVRSSEDRKKDPAVIIHDAARPNLTASHLSDYLGALDGHDGVMPALPMKDTVYLCSDGKTVTGLLDRSMVYAGQAPEIYRLEKYLAANERLLPDEILKINGSSEPAILAGLSVSVVKGDENNYKITTAADLERFVHSRRTHEGTRS
ncbi:MAG: 2-C-methyl-D-erythritol 4-phosphate cytidylyltransferase [Lachnospiraceae bacterium]|nr:2-C-methyl-D-erythritol 4-phosphate cytidylyltransferase [Lachnospiraceae bacterium]